MSSSVCDLITVLQSFFPGAVPLPTALCVLASVVSVFPLLRLHKNQRRDARQPQRTVWFNSITSVLLKSFHAEQQIELEQLYIDEDHADGCPPEQVLSEDITHDMEGLYEFLALDESTMMSPYNLFPRIPTILITSHTHCTICPQQSPPSLRCCENFQTVRLLDSDFEWYTAYLFIAHCSSCCADHYPDKVTYVSRDLQRQKLEYDATYLCVSKTGVWMHRKIALAQEHALYRFHSGWSNFAGWLNDTLESKPEVTNRQSQRLFIEHFSRRLLSTHGMQNDFSCSVHPTSAELAESVCNLLGQEGGVIPSSMHHTHRKRYRVDLLAEGAILDNTGENVAGMATDLQDGHQVCYLCYLKP
jgi:hypothetical protein